MSVPNDTGTDTPLPPNRNSYTPGGGRTCALATSRYDYRLVGIKNPFWTRQANEAKSSPFEKRLVPLEAPRSRECSSLSFGRNT